MAVILPLHETSEVKTGKGKVFQATVPGACEKWCRLWGPGRTAGGMGGDLSAGRRGMAGRSRQGRSVCLYHLSNAE